MGDHHHNHHHHHSGSNIKVAFFLNLAFTVLEIIGGIFVNSVAILSDAIHDLGDSLALGSAWYLQHKSKQESDESFSFGYARFSLLGALINSVVLITGSIFVVKEAIERLMYPEASDATGMIIFALLGVAVNGYAAYKMSGGKSLNEKVVSWHLLEDVLGWVAVLVVGTILYFYPELEFLDPALSIFITLYILWNVMKRLKETLFIFLQGIPEEIDVLKIEADITKIMHVKSLHHTHVWSLEGEHHVFSTHIKLENITEFHQIIEAKKAVKEYLSNYNFTHYTIETELDNESCGLH